MKKFTTGEINLMKKYNVVDADASPCTSRTNPISGVSVQLNLAGASLHDTIISMYRNYERGMKFNSSEWDRLRYLFLKLYPNAYYDLID